MSLPKETPLTSLMAFCWTRKMVVASLVAMLLEDFICSRSANARLITIDVLSAESYTASPDDN